MSDPDSTELRQKILSFAQGKSGTQVGTGECYDLADRALAEAGAKSASDFGTVTPTADYVWGQDVPLSQTRPGDILQFHNQIIISKHYINGFGATF